jgi:hypothetical protein
MKTRVFICLVFLVAVAQGQLSLNNYYMDFSPNSVQVNPAQAPRYKAFIGVPVLGNVDVNFKNSGFTLSDVLDNNTLTIDDLVEALSENNTLSLGLNTSVLSFGFTIDSLNYFSFSSNVNGTGAFNYSGKFMRFFLLGQGNEEFIGKTVSLDGTSISSSVYLENALGWSRGINHQLRIGGRLKVLNGAFNVNADMKDVSVYTENEDYDISFISNFEMRSAGLSFENPMSNLSKNLGLGVDAGATYQLTDEIILSASMIDFGYIRWNGETRKYFHDNASFDYEGIDFSSFQEGDGDYFENLGDSIVEIFELQEDSNFSYTTYLPTRFVVGGQYSLNKLFTADALISTNTLAGRTKASFIIGGTIELKRTLQARLSYGYINGTNNFGGSIAANLGAFQLFLLADNLVGFSQLDYTKSLNLQFGMNIVIGK